MEKEKLRRVIVSGLAVTGKSLVKDLAAHYSLPYFSAGNFAREIAAAESLTLEDRIKNAESSRDFDQKIDGRMVEFTKTASQFVCEWRLGFFFFPKSQKILLTCEDQVRFERAAGREKISVEEAKRSIKDRDRKDTGRYQEYYGIDDFADPKHYDHVIDTTSLNKDEVLAEMIRLTS